jgi:two-component system, sensor histidine kinase ChiS
VTSGSLLIFGVRAKGVARRLSALGYACETVDAGHTPHAQHPDAIVVAADARSIPAVLANVRKSEWLRHVPVLVERGRAPVTAFRELGVDGVANSPVELASLLASSISARRLERKESLVRRRLELLLEMSKARSVDEGLLQTIAAHASEAMFCREVSLLCTVDDAPGKTQWTSAERSHPVDLSLSPKLHQALAQGVPLRFDGAWLVPLRGPLLAARIERTKTIEPEELDFLEAVATALTQVSETHRSRDGQQKTRDTLESAYVSRYRELIEANRRLNAVDRRKNELLAVLSHDLRAPLNVQLGHSHLLLSDDALAPTLRPSVEAIQRSAKRILEMIESLLEKSRLGEGRVPLFSKTMDVALTCQESGRELAILARDKGLTLTVEAAISLLVFGDELKIRQVIQNLLTNALNHARGASKITLRALLKKRPDGDVAQIEVQDDGHVDDVNAVLLAFDRSKGIGLSIAREYVERHGGEIWAEAPASGGARFVFTLPLRAERPAPLRKASSAPLVLVAEDDPIFARMCEAGLAAHYRVELLRDGREVISRSKALMPDAIVLDVFLPHRDGLELLRELKSTPETADIPVLLISGLPDIDEKLRSLDLGAFDFLTKPFPLSVLLGRLSSAMSRNQSGAAPQALGNDAETGLFDHFGILNRLNDEIARSAHFRRPLAVAVLRPKTPPLKQSIVELARLVRKSLRTPDVVAHVGQGTWVLLLPETTEIAAEPVLARLVAQLSEQDSHYSVRVLDVGESPHTGEAILEKLLSRENTDTA